MALRSALEDLKETTLRRVSGLLGRLEYFARLRTPDGKYSHWGLARTHGEAAAQDALSEAHRSTTAGVLRTPLRKMVQDAEASSGAQGVSAESYTKRLEGEVSNLLPPSPGAGSGRHLKSVLRALSYLTKTR
jgi:hypothetical protein